MTMLSVMGMFEYDPDIFFDNFNIPDDMDGDSLLYQLLAECAELELIYPEPQYFAYALGSWSSVMMDKWSRIHAVMTAEYNPIWNKDGNFYEKEKLSNTAGTKVSAFNQTSDFVDSGQVKNDGTVERWRQEHGNIGVTTTQQMIKEEVEVANINLYEIIINDFKHRFCIMVY